MSVVNKMKNMTDSKLEKCVEALRDGDYSGFGYIYERTNRAVYFAAQRILTDKHRSEDIVQDTYMTAVKKIALYKSDTNFTAWLVTISKRLALNEYTKLARGEIFVDLQQKDDIARYDEIKETPVLDLAKKILNDDEYHILTLCCVARYKRREVAQMLDIPLPTVTWKYGQAIKKLEKIIREENL